MLIIEYFFVEIPQELIDMHNRILFVCLQLN